MQESTSEGNVSVKGLELGRRPALLISGLHYPFADDQHGERIAVLAGCFREKNLPVFHCLVEAWLGFLSRNMQCIPAPQYEALTVVGSRCTRLDPRDIVCAGGDGMASAVDTGLDAFLRAMSVDTIVFCGASTKVALMGACVEATSLGYSVVVANDCTATGLAVAGSNLLLPEHLPLVAEVASADVIALSAALVHRARTMS